MTGLEGFIKDIAGLSGEELATAFLKVLINKSPVVANCVWSLAHVAAGQAGLVPLQPISAETEVRTESEELDNGRIDLEISSGEFGFGIEVKIWAGFQGNQPRKYLEHLTNKFREKSFVIVLAPEAKRKEVVEHLRDHQRLKYITWEYLINALQNLKTDLIEDFLIKALGEYLNEHRDWWTNSNLYKSTCENALGPYRDKGSDEQALIARRFKRFFPGFPGAVSRMACRNTYLGCYFLNNQPERGWFGFVPGKRAFCDPQTSVFVVCLPDTAEWRDGETNRIFTRIHRKHDLSSNTTKPDQVYTVNIKQLQTEEEWQQAFNGLTIFKSISEAGP